MIKGFKPLLACEADLEKLEYPLWASPKIDGIRAIVFGGKVYSRKLIEIPNQYVQAHFSPWAHQLDKHDGELIVGKPYGEGVFSRTTSGVMSKEGTPTFTFYVFDIVAEIPHYSKRYNYILRLSAHADPHFVKVLKQHWVEDEEELLDYERAMLEKGYEGLVLRSPEGRYKYGRSTVKEGIMLKLKRFTDEEAVVVGFEEQMHNGNEATKDNLGRTKRSSHKANKTGKDTLGKLVCESPHYTETFKIGTGFTAEQREIIWQHQATFFGATVKFKHQPYGQKDRPRNPVFLGWRKD